MTSSSPVDVPGRLLVAVLSLALASCGITDNDEQERGPVTVLADDLESCRSICVAGTEDTLRLTTFYGMDEEPGIAPGVLVRIESLSDAVEVDSPVRTGSDGTATTAIRFLRPADRAEIRLTTPEVAGPAGPPVWTGGVVAFRVFAEHPRIALMDDSLVLEVGCSATVGWEITVGGEPVEGLEPEYFDVRSPRIASFVAGDKRNIMAVSAGRTSLYTWLEDGGTRIEADMPIRVTEFQPKSLELGPQRLFLGDAAPIGGRVVGQCTWESVDLAEVLVTNHTPDILAYDSQEKTLTAVAMGLASYTAEYGGFSVTPELPVLDYRVLPQDTILSVGDTLVYRPQSAVGDTVYREWVPSLYNHMSYTSSDTSVVTVSRREGIYGVVTARGEGSAKITYCSEDRHGHETGPTRQVTVTVGGN